MDRNTEISAKKRLFSVCRIEALFIFGFLCYNKENELEGMLL